MLHRDKFSAKNRGLDGRLSFGNPIDAGHIDVNEETSARATGSFLAVDASTIIPSYPTAGMTLYPEILIKLWLLSIEQK